DFVVSPVFGPADEQTHVEVLYNEPLVVVAGAQSPWARRRKIELAALTNESWTLPPEKSLYGSVVVEAFRAAGLDLPRAAVFTSVTPVRNALVATGRYLSIVQGSIAGFGPNNPAWAGLPVHPSSTRPPLASLTLNHRALSTVAHR